MRRKIVGGVMIIIRHLFEKCQVFGISAIWRKISNVRHFENCYLHNVAIFAIYLNPKDGKKRPWPPSVNLIVTTIYGWTATNLLEES